MTNIKDTILDISKKVVSLDSVCIPNGTVFNVKQDGTGDFADLYEAINFLQGKYSTGEVILQLDSGTYNLPSILNYYGNNTNIPILKINGKGINNTILQTNYRPEVTSEPIICINVNANVSINNLSIIHESGDKTTNYCRGIEICQYSTLDLYNVKIKGFNLGLTVFDNSTCRLSNSFQVDNCGTAVNVDNGATVVTTWNANVSMSNCYYGYSCYRGGKVCLFATIENYSNVSNRKYTESGGAVYGP